MSYTKSYPHIRKERPFQHPVHQTGKQKREKKQYRVAAKEIKISILKPQRTHDIRNSRE